jgi:tetratricopeptide (TPR) repeat protein
VAGVRITRKEIKRDELATTIGDLRSAVQDHSRSVAIAAGALILLSVAIAGGIWFSRSRETASQVKLAAVYRAAGAPVTEEDTLAGQAAKAYPTRRQKYEDVERLASEVLSAYPSSKSAKWATYYKAVAQKELGNYPEALHTLEPLAADTADDFLSASSKFMQAQVHEAQGDAAGALEIYASLAATASERFPADMVLMNQARVLEGQGKIDEAREIYRRIMQEYPDSPFTREATERANPAKG